MLTKFYIFWKRHPIKISIIVSLLIHVFTLFSLGEWGYLFTWVPDNTSVKAEQEPLQFELVENPNAPLNEKSPERGNLLSDRNSRAKSNAKTSLPEGQMPYSEGTSMIPEPPRLPGNGNVPPVQPQETNQNKEQQNEAGKEQKVEATTNKEMHVDKSSMAAQENAPAEGLNPAIKFSRDYLVQSSPPQNGGESFYITGYDNQKYDAKEIGDFTLNTYAWDFAPYLLELKRRIQRNIFPPPAFTILGIIEGEFVLQFGIVPNGRLEFLRVLDSNGHPSLELTSRKSIELSAPFPPLPANFPEKKLIITGRFMYSVYREAARARRRGY